MRRLYYEKTTWWKNKKIKKLYDKGIYYEKTLWWRDNMIKEQHDKKT